MCCSRGRAATSEQCDAIYSTPPAELLQSPRPGDYAILVPPVSKADSTGEVWGALPIYLHLQATDPDAVRCESSEGGSPGACTVPEDLGTRPSSAGTGLLAFHGVDIGEGESEQLAYRELVRERR